MPAAARSLVLLLLGACSSGGTDPEPIVQPPPDSAAFADVSATHLPGRVGPGQSMEARAADFDRDGDLDLLVAREFEPNVLLLNDGRGRFSDASDRIPQVALDSEDVAVGDFDRDGDPDAVVVTEDAMQGRRFNEYYLNDGRGTFSDARARLPATVGESNAVAAGDLDGDGDLDLVVSDRGPELVWINDGRGTFADETRQRSPDTADSTQDVALGDVDGDRDLDLLVGNDEGPNRLLLNDGTGRFTPAPAASLPMRASREVTRNADLGDVDRDGDLDILFANVTLNGGSTPSRLLLNDGRGAFTDATAQRLPGATVWMDSDLVDMDRDGDLDLVTSPFPFGSYLLFLNEGGSFADATARMLPRGLSGQGIEVEAGDYDGDGKMDLYYANFAESPDMLLLAR